MDKDTKLLLWEIIAVIHTFGGSIMITALSSKLTNSLPLLLGVFIFFMNFILIFYSVKTKIGKLTFCKKAIDMLDFTFFVSLADMLIFTIALLT